MWKHIAKVGAIAGIGIGASILADMFWPESDEDSCGCGSDGHCQDEPEIEILVPEGEKK